MLKGIVNSVPKDIIRIPMFDNGVEHEGWEVRDQQGRIIWGADKTLTGTDSISFKGYGLPLKEYSIDGNMVQAAEKEYSITDIPPIDFMSDGNGLSAYSIYGNMVQASSQQYSLTGTSPLSFKSDANTLAAWSIYGNGRQTGTPTPDNPIMPDFVGERTGNLFDVSDVILGYHVATNGMIELKENRMCTAHNIDLTGISEVTLSFQTSLTQGARAIFALYNAGTLVVRHVNVLSGNSIDVSAGDSCLIAFYSNDSNIEVNTQNVTNIMLNSGATALPYEPFGYKIPITSAGQTVPVYLGQTVTTRRIKKLVLTGSEEWTIPLVNDYGIANFLCSTVVSDRLGRTGNVLCSHFVYNTDTNANVTTENIRITNANNLTIRRFSADFPTVDSIKSWLSTQYQNGTPICVWYVLATPTTGIVNEPLCKIGDYVDELHSADVAVTIPTVSGDNTLSIDTTLQPSSVSITTSSGVWPENPITPEETGDLVESGDYAGKYAIPVTNAGTTTNIYALEPLRKIGDYSDFIDENGVCTRSIKKLVLDGTEASWASGTTYYTISISLNLGKSLEKAICSHAPYETGVAVNSDGTVLYFRKSDFSDYSDLTAFKAFLAQQYANGNPVTVWYVLATPTTEQITSPTLSTTNGNNTLSIGTTLQPSNVSLTTSSSVYPLNPIIPEMCGVRTRNILQNVLSSTEVNGVIFTVNADKSITVNGRLTTEGNAYVTVGTVAFESGEMYTIDGVYGYTASTLQLFTQSSSSFAIGNRLQSYNGYVTRTAAASETCGIRLYVYANTTYDNVTVYPQIVKGNAASLYEPYGYKIPITPAGQTQNVYLGQTQTVRRIRKYEFTGNESWSLHTDTGTFYTFAISNFLKASGITCICSHYPSQENVDGAGRVFLEHVCFRTSTYNQFYLRDTDFDSTDALKAYLAAQYAAGTPVTVWYVLAEPATGIVNEPLCKIGDYADELHSEDAAVTIPTIEGQNTLTVDTTLPPSEMTVKGHIKPIQ